VGDNHRLEPAAGDRVTFDVIIPVYRHEEEVPACVESVLAQTYPCSRIFLVDNAPQPVLRSQGLDPRVSILHQPVPGSYAARNLGIAHSNASHLAFVDADCRADDGWLEAGARYLADNPEAHILGGPVRWFPRDERPTAVEAFDMAFSPSMKTAIEKWGFSGTGNLIVDRVVFSQVGPFRADFLSGGDLEFGRRAAAQGFQTRFVSGQIVYHVARRRLSEVCRQRARYQEAARRLLGEAAGHQGIRPRCREFLPPVRGMGRFLTRQWGCDYPLSLRVKIAMVHLLVHYYKAFYGLYRAMGLGHDLR